MGEPHNIFSKEDIEWFEEIDEIMKRAVAKAKAENKRLGLDAEDFKVKKPSDTEGSKEG